MDPALRIHLESRSATAAFSGGIDDPRLDPYVLSIRERRIVGALACGLYDPCGIGIASGKLDVSLANVVEDVETWLGTPHPALRAVFRALLFSIEVSRPTLSRGVRGGVPSDVEPRCPVRR